MEIELIFLNEWFIIEWTLRIIQLRFFFKRMKIKDGVEFILVYFNVLVEKRETRKGIVYKGNKSMT